MEFIYALPLFFMHLILALCVFMGIFFLIGIVCIVISFVKMVTHHDFDERGSFYDIEPLTKEAKEWKKEVERIKGKPSEKARKSRKKKSGSK